MNQFEARLAALPATEAMKLRELARLVGPEMVLQLMEHAETTQMKALAAGVAFKAAPTSWLDPISATIQAHPVFTFRRG